MSEDSLRDAREQLNVLIATRHARTNVLHFICNDPFDVFMAWGS